MQVKSNLASLRGKLEEKHQRPYTVEEIARGSDLSRHTITSLINDDASAIYFDTITNLLTYLREQGLIVELSDLLTVEESTGKVPGKLQPVQVTNGGVVNAV